MYKRRHKTNLYPFTMGLDRITGQRDHLHSQPLKLWHQFCDTCQLCRADRCEIIWMRKQDAPSTLAHRNIIHKYMTSNTNPCLTRLYIYQFYVIYTYICVCIYVYMPYYNLLAIFGYVYRIFLHVYI